MEWGGSGAECSPDSRLWVALLLAEEGRWCRAIFLQCWVYRLEGMVLCRFWGFGYEGKGRSERGKRAAGKAHWKMAAFGSSCESAALASSRQSCRVAATTMHIVGCQHVALSHPYGLGTRQALLSPHVCWFKQPMRRLSAGELRALICNA